MPPQDPIVRNLQDLIDQIKKIQQDAEALRERLNEANRRYSESSEGGLPPETPPPEDSGA